MEKIELLMHERLTEVIMDIGDAVKVVEGKGKFGRKSARRYMRRELKRRKEAEDHAAINEEICRVSRCKENSSNIVLSVSSPPGSCKYESANVVCASSTYPEDQPQFVNSAPHVSAPPEANFVRPQSKRGSKSKPRFGAMCSCSTQCEVVEGAESSNSKGVAAEKVYMRRLKVNGNIHDEEAEDYESEVEEEDEDFDNRSISLVDSSDEEEEETGDDVMDSSDDEESDDKLGISFAGPQGPAEIYHPSLTKTGRGSEQDEDGTGHAPESKPCIVGEEVGQLAEDRIAILERRIVSEAQGVPVPGVVNIRDGRAYVRSRVEDVLKEKFEGEMEDQVLKRGLNCFLNEEGPSEERTLMEAGRIPTGWKGEKEGWMRVD